MVFTPIEKEAFLKWSDVLQSHDTTRERRHWLRGIIILMNDNGFNDSTLRLIDGD